MRAIALIAGFCWYFAFGQAAATVSFPEEGDRLIVHSLAPFAKREGNALTLRVATGRVIRLVDGASCDAPETCMKYRLLGTSPNKKFFVVEVHGYESRTLFWIGRNSGKQYEVFAEPQMSLDGRWIVTANPSEFGGTNGVFVWEVQGDELVERMHFEPASYALYRFVRWAGDDRVVIEKFTHASKSICPDAQFMKIFVTVAKEGNHWRLDERTGLGAAVCQ